MSQQESGRSYEMNHDRLRDLGSFALGAMEATAASNPSAEVRQFAQQQLDIWVQHGYVTSTTLGVTQ